MSKDVRFFLERELAEEFKPVVLNQPKENPALTGEQKRQLEAMLSAPALRFPLIRLSAAVDKAIKYEKEHPDEQPILESPREATRADEKASNESRDMLVAEVSSATRELEGVIGRPSREESKEVGQEIRDVIVGGKESLLESAAEIYRRQKESRPDPKDALMLIKENLKERPELREQLAGDLRAAKKSELALNISSEVRRVEDLNSGGRISLSEDQEEHMARNARLAAEFVSSPDAIKSMHSMYDELSRIPLEDRQEQKEPTASQKEMTAIIDAYVKKVEPDSRDRSDLYQAIHAAIGLYGSQKSTIEQLERDFLPQAHGRSDEGAGEKKENAPKQQQGDEMGMLLPDDLRAKLASTNLSLDSSTTGPLVPAGARGKLGLA